MAARYQIAGRTAAAIAASVETGVRGGDLAADTALPPVRQLAGTLGVAPATVAAAYRTLRERGLVATAGRHGTRVRGRPAVDLPRSHRTVEVPPGALDLAAGGPDPRLLPDLRPYLRELAGDPPGTAGDRGELAGDPRGTAGNPAGSAGVAPEPLGGAGRPGAGYGPVGPLPDLVDLARKRLAADGVPAATAGITVTSGALDAIERVLAAHLAPGDPVAVEDPGWANLLDLVAAMGLRPVPVAVDGAGPAPQALATALAAGARAVIVTTRAHNPTGASVSRQRAAALRAVLAGHPDVLVVEDDHAAELAEGPPHPLVPGRRYWAFIRSVSKPYGPDLRLAVCAGDEVSIGRVAGRMRLGPGWVSTLLQRLVVALWRDPAVADSLVVARDSYRARRHGLCETLRRAGIPASGGSGINVWVPVPDEVLAVTRLRDAGYVVAPGAWYRLASPPGIRITVSPLDPGGVQPLAQAVRRAIAPGGPRRGTA